MPLLLELGCQWGNGGAGPHVSHIYQANEARLCGGLATVLEKTANVHILLRPGLGSSIKLLSSCSIVQSKSQKQHWFAAWEKSLLPIPSKWACRTIFSVYHILRYIVAKRLLWMWQFFVVHLSLFPILWYGSFHAYFLVLLNRKFFGVSSKASFSPINSYGNWLLICFCFVTIIYFGYLCNHKSVNIQVIFLVGITTIWFVIPEEFRMGH